MLDLIGHVQNIAGIIHIVSALIILTPANQKFYQLCSSCFPLCLYYAPIWTTKFYCLNVLLEYLRHNDIDLFDSMHFSAFWMFYLSVLSHLRPYRIFICTNCSIREYHSDFSPLCWHNMPTYYALNYAGIFDRGLY